MRTFVLLCAALAVAGLPAGCADKPEPQPKLEAQAAAPTVARPYGERSTASPAASRPASSPAETLTAQLDAACQKMSQELADKLGQSKVAVLPFLDADEGVRAIGVLAAQQLRKCLLDRGVKLVDRQNLDLLLAQRDFNIASAGSGQGYKQIADLSGADVLIVGQTMLAWRQVLVSARATQLSSGRLLAQTSGIALPCEDLGNLVVYVNRPPRAQGAELPPLSVKYEFVTPTTEGELHLADGGAVTSGQKFKIRIQANSDCCIYVLLYDSQGHASVLFPHAQVGLSNEVRGGVSYEVPDGTKWYFFDDRPGDETFYVVASYEPLDDLRDVLAKMEQAPLDRERLSTVARDKIEVVTRGMDSSSAAGYQPKGYTVRGVGGVTEGAPVGRGAVDNVVTGFATAVKRISLRHR